MHPKFLIAAIAVAALVPAAAGAAVPNGHVWKTYVNVHFNYSVCYPADLLTPQPESPNSDGRKFVGKDGATMLAYGSNNVLDTPAATAAKQTGARLAGTSGKITYSAVRPKWFVVSGSSDAANFYAKSLYSGDQVKAFELTYPTSAAATWSRIAGTLNQCFHNTVAG